MNAPNPSVRRANGGGHAVEVILANDLPVSSWNTIAQTISEQSEAEQNMLARSEDYFLEQITANRMLVARRYGEIVGVVCVHQLSDATSEIGSAWVSKFHRGKGIYSSLKEAAVQLARKLKVGIVSTAKVTISLPSPGLNSSVSRGMLPVSFRYLQQRDQAAYESCCSCDEDRNHLSCDERDKSCVLSAHISNKSDLWSVMSFISSRAWQGVDINKSQKSDIYQEIALQRTKLIN